MEIDLADLNSVDKCANQLKRELPGIDVLVNNAGVMAIPQREVTKDGFEKHLGINHLGHFALTSLLMDLIQKDSGNGNKLKRIVNISSAAHLLGKIDRTDLMLDRTADSYEPWHAYGNSKLGNNFLDQSIEFCICLRIIFTSCSSQYFVYERIGPQNEREIYRLADGCGHSLLPSR